MTDDPTPRITLLKNGPLRVSDLQRFTNSRGEPIATTKTMVLCRCGASKTKPLCDGTHASIGFDDSKADDRVPDQLDTYSGSRLAVLDNRGVCSHAGHCTSGLPQVWRMRTEPWIDPDAAPPEDIVRVVRQCPSGALAWEQDNVRHDTFSDEATVQVSRDGPYWVRGGVALDGVEFGEGASREHFALCRCGHSRNKPFCDGSHWYAGFKDDEALTISQANATPSDRATTWVAVGRADAFARDRVNAVQIGTRSVALVSTEQGWRAVDGRCPHQGGPLTEGTLCDGAVPGTATISISGQARASATTMPSSPSKHGRSTVRSRLPRRHRHGPPGRLGT